jgi:hypothetical protein
MMVLVLMEMVLVVEGLVPAVEIVPTRGMVADLVAAVGLAKVGLGGEEMHHTMRLRMKSLI